MADERILIVDDEEGLRKVLKIMLSKEGYDVQVADSGADALQILDREAFDAVISDIKMPAMSGIELLKQIRARDPGLPVVMMTAYAALDTAIEAVNQGAFHYFVKQTSNEEIKLVVRRALEISRLRSENKYLKHELKKTLEPRKIIGRSPRIQEVFDTIRKVAKADSTVLLCGESGTGKELFARQIHHWSRRATGPFVSINCGALPESLLESELFGHVKGSFTGAVRDKEGLFIVARGGTFFLDEVGETSQSIQVKLLRILQEREIIPVGGQKPVKVDVRVVAATNADLELEVERGTFRADLFYRLNVIPVTLPPLRSRREDIPLLVDHFLQHYCRVSERPMMEVSDEAMQALGHYAWPGNVRELENVIERGVILEEGPCLTLDSLPDRVVSQRASDEALLAGIDADGNLTGTLEDVERDYMMKVLEVTGWQKKRASTILGINSSTLYRKIQRYGLDPEKTPTSEDADS
ncbi:MAG: acetoacetate metabolism regulatory protein AtoC [Gemmatimonadota bacterium]|nr:MAG: acetoacetate metabolism regulatory protein AtoC [Gemmatimonadota bacterium]